MGILAGIILGGVLWRYPEWLGIQPGTDRQTIGLLVISATVLVLVMLLSGAHLGERKQGRSFYRHKKPDDAVRPAQVTTPESTEVQTAQKIDEIKTRLRIRYPFLWRRKVRVLLVVGEPAQVEAIAPRLIRLLEKAKITPLDDGNSRYRVVLTAPDGLDMTWHLRTELSAGPLALLKLRGFTLPSQIFLSDR
jgi:type VI secretion system protein ImpL